MARTFTGFSRRPLSDPYALAVGARSDRGGYERAQSQDANSPENLYGRGQHTSPQFGNQPAVTNTLTQNLDLSQRAGAHDQAVADDERMERRKGGMQNPYLKDKRWSALLQALTEAGADRMQTGAKAGWEQPGFYDTQSTMDAGAQGRQQLLDALIAGQGAGSFQDDRREAQAREDRAAYLDAQDAKIGRTNIRRYI